MKKNLLFLYLFVFTSLLTFAQPYTPVSITGFNHDVIAEGTGNSSLATTTKEMDAITPSNYVICSQQFAASNSIPAGYGLPDNGLIVNGTRSYQISSYGTGTAPTNNVLYLLRTESGLLTLATPSSFTNLSLLVLATEGAAAIDVTVNFTDGSTQLFASQAVVDWVNGANPMIQGFGRIKRIVGPFIAGTYEQAPTNPRMYAVDMAVPCDKIIASLSIINVTTGTNPASNRAFIFALSGVSAPIAPAPVVNPPGSICAGNNVTITLQNPVTGVSYSWFSAASGGSLLGTGTSFNTGTLIANTNFYVQSTNAAGCANPNRTLVTVTVLPAPALPTVNGASICSGTTATLTVQNPVQGETYSWYGAASGGTALVTGTSFTTPALTANTTYYVDAQTTSCGTPTRRAVTVTILPPLAAPAIAGASICSGNTATLTVQNSVSGTSYTWFAAATGGTSFFTGTSYTTPTLSATTTYYVQAENQAGCISATRTAVTVNVTTTPAAPAANNATICYGTTAVLNVQSPITGYIYNWFSAASGGSPFFTGTSYTTPALTANATYYIEAQNGSCASTTRGSVTVTVAPQVNNPTLTDASICSGGTATLAVNSPVTGITYLWYSTISGGTSFFTGTSYTTPALTANVTYYVQAQNANNCLSPFRSPVSVTILPAPLTPVITSASICPNSTATLIVQNPQTGSTYAWYTAATGGTSIFTGTSFTTPTLSATTSYYVQVTTAQSCTNTTRGIGTVNIQGPLPDPIVDNITLCTNSTATLPVKNAIVGIVYTWYTSATGGTPFFTGPIYTTPALTANTTYYVFAQNPSGCSSSQRTAVTVSVAQLLATPVVTSSNITVSSITFNWQPVPGAAYYEVSVNGGNYVQPSTGSQGTSHFVNFLSYGQQVTIAVKAYAQLNCQTSQPGTLTARTTAPNVYVPSGFSPNGDNINDVLMVLGNGFTAMQFAIFNQWGEKVFESFDKARGWDGKYKGKAQNSSVFIYVLSVKLDNGSEIRQRGSITLIR